MRQGIQLLLCMLLFSNIAYSEPCLRYSSEESVVDALEFIAPMGSRLTDLKSILAKDCADSDIKEHFYQGSPLKHGDSGTKLEVWSWVKISEGPYRFARRLFLKTQVVATIFFNKQGNVVGYKAELQTDSL